MHSLYTDVQLACWGSRLIDWARLETRDKETLDPQRGGKIALLTNLAGFSHKNFRNTVLETVLNRLEQASFEELKMEGSGMGPFNNQNHPPWRRPQKGDDNHHH